MVCRPRGLQRAQCHLHAWLRDCGPVTEPLWASVSPPVRTPTSKAGCGGGVRGYRQSAWQVTHS